MAQREGGEQIDTWTLSIPLSKARQPLGLGAQRWEGYDDAIFPLSQGLLDGHGLVHAGPY